MSRGKYDRGLKAVRRVRSVRERDSKIGLQQALSVSRKREEQAEAARVRLAASAPFRSGTVAAYQLHVLLKRARAEEVAVKEEEVRTSKTVVDEATWRWTLDRQAVRVVELLLERRAEERQVERARREAQELDELASQAWLRDRTDETPGEGS